jgi:hypothetical protein
MDGFNLSAPQREILNGIPYSVLRETVRDYMVNQQFRRDLYTRGARRLSALERMERLHQLRVTLVVADGDVNYEVETTLGKIALKKEIYEPIVMELAANDSAPKTVGEMAERPKIAALPPGALIEALSVLISSGRAHPAQSDEAIALAKPRTDVLNAYLIDRARISGDITWLASPVIGGGVSVGRFEQMFLGARAKGQKNAKDWAKTAWEILSKQNQAIIKDGAVLQGAEANLDELGKQATVMADKRLAQLQRLGVVS